MVQDLVDFVAQWHKDMNIDFREPMSQEAYLDRSLAETIVSMKRQSNILEGCYKVTGDLRHLRMHLILEETAEQLSAMVTGDPVDALDGMCDVLFVQAGTAVTFGWDLAGALEEVCKSNATKRPSTGDPRLRNKGNSFVPPSLERFIS